MTPRKPRFFALATTCGVFACTLACAQTITCPPRFPMKVLQFGPTDDGWTAGAGDPAAPLESVGLFSGPPAEGAELKPTSANGTRVSWELDEPIPGGVWLQCAYGRNALTLARPLPTAPKVCAAKYGKEQAFQPRQIEFSCR